MKYNPLTKRFEQETEEDKKNKLQKDLSTFLIDVARRKGKAKSYYVDMADRLYRNPQIMQVRIGDGRRLKFVTVAGAINIRDNGMRRFGILSNGEVVSYYSDEHKFIKLDHVVVDTECCYLLPDYKRFIFKVMQTAPSPCPAWAYDWIARYEATGSNCENFNEALAQQIEYRFWKRLGKGFTDRDMLRWLVANESGKTDRPLGSFFDCNNIGYSMGVGGSYLLAEAVSAYVGGIADLHLHPPPSDPVWQVSIRDIVAREIARQEFEGRRD